MEPGGGNVRVAFKRAWPLVGGIVAVAMVGLAACTLGGQSGSPPADAPETLTSEVVAAAPTTPVPALAKAPAPPPNILLITVDTLRPDAIGAYGNRRVQTPNMDRLAREGALFSSAYTAFSQTNPSHASIFTGAYAATHGLRHHLGSLIKPSVPTLAQVLRDSSYNTAGIFSWSSLEGPASGLDRSFETYKGIYVEVKGQTDVHRGIDGRADVTTDAVLTYLSKEAKPPLFLWVHYQDPHFPYMPPAPYNEMYEPACTGCTDGGWEIIDRMAAGEQPSPADAHRILGLYYGEVSFADTHIGRAIDSLKRAGSLDNTMVILTADHGESMGEEGKWSHPYILHDSVLRVPLIIRYPRMVTGGTVVRGLSSTVDIMPTVLEALGFPVPGEVEGRSLWPLINGKSDGAGRTVVAEVPDSSLIAVYLDKWKLVRDNRTKALRLYDLATDPAELSDLATANPQQASILERRGKLWMDQHAIEYKD